MFLLITLTVKRGYFINPVNQGLCSTITVRYLYSFGLLFICTDYCCNLIVISILNYYLFLLSFMILQNCKKL